MFTSFPLLYAVLCKKRRVLSLFFFFSSGRSSAVTAHPPVDSISHSLSIYIQREGKAKLGIKKGGRVQQQANIYSRAATAVQSSIIVSFRQARIKNLAKWNGCRKPLQLIRWALDCRLVYTSPSQPVVGSTWRKEKKSVGTKGSRAPASARRHHRISFINGSTRQSKIERRAPRRREKKDGRHQPRLLRTRRCTNVFTVGAVDDSHHLPIIEMFSRRAHYQSIS